MFTPVPKTKDRVEASIARPERALAAGCDDYDTKPVELNRLLEKIEALVPGAIRSEEKSSGE